MKCSDLRSNLSLYADGLTSDGEAVSIAGHLETCPLCRQRYAETREIRDSLRQLPRAEMSSALRNKIKLSVRHDIRKKKHSWMPVSSDVLELLQMRVMPYGVGVFASVLIGVTFITMMFSGMFSVAPGGNAPVMFASTTNPFDGMDVTDITPRAYAQTRLGFGSESPSINPQGALIAMTKSLVRGGMEDDEVVVVADVFGNGLAHIAEVVEPSRDQRAVGELQKALESDPAFAAFVPANMENRPDSVRVVLKFQSVDVNIGTKRSKRRL